MLQPFAARYLASWVQFLCDCKNIRIYKLLLRAVLLQAQAGAA
jgi:hypothetical protein